MKLIGLTGRAQHGKDSSGSHIVTHWNFQRAAFADQLKDLALLINPVVIDYADAEGPMLRLADAVTSLGWEDAKRIPEVRRFLQELGTGVRTVIGDDAWVNALEKTLMPGVNYVITDVRFPNEAKWVHDHGGIVVRVTRPNFDNGLGDNHPSESNVPNLYANYDVVAEEMGELLTAIDGVMRDVEEGFVPAPRTMSATLVASIAERYA